MSKEKNCNCRCGSRKFVAKNPMGFKVCRDCWIKEKNNIEEESENRKK